MNTTPRKHSKTKRSTQSASKKRSASSKTKTSLSNSTKNTAKEKIDSSQLATQKHLDASLLSSARSKMNTVRSQGLSLHAVLQNLKKRSIKDAKKGKSGFVSIDKEEHEAIKNAKFSNAIGRPKKSVEERQNVESMRFSTQEKNLLIACAKKYGFNSWKECVKSIALEFAAENLPSTYHLR